MATKSITITEEAYDRLKAHKRRDESFSDVVNRLTGADTDVWKGYGMMRDVDGFREAVEQAREEFDQDARKREEELWGDELRG